MKRQELLKQLPGVSDAQLRKAIAALELPATDNFDYTPSQVETVVAYFSQSPKSRKAKPSQQQPNSAPEPTGLKGEALAKTQEESQAAQGQMVTAKQRTIAAIKAVNTREGEADAQLGLAAYTSSMLQTQVDGYNDIADSLVASLEAFDTIRDATFLDDNSEDLLQLPATPRSHSKAKAGFSLDVDSLKTKLNQQLEALEVEQKEDPIALLTAEDATEEGADPGPFEEDNRETPDSACKTDFEPYLESMLTSLP